MTSTDTPAAFTIHPHCESAFTARWPRHIFFHCEVAAAKGGRTPVTDVRAVTRDIDEGVREKFEREGIMYVRTFGKRIGLDWRDVFQVNDRMELERYCIETCIAFEWLRDGRLRTCQVRPAIARHPQTGEPLWFNHALALHASSLDPKLRTAILRQSSEAGLPQDTRFGSGEIISDEVMAHIRDVHTTHTVRFDWQPGDVLLLDNMLAAHGREPYEGARRVTTVMANPWSWSASGVALKLPDLLPELHQAGDSRAGAALEGVSREALERWLIGAVAAELKIASATIDDNLQDLGGDSLVAVALAERFVDEFGADIPIEFFLEADTLGDFVSKILRSRAR